MEGVEGAASLPLVQHRRRLLILPRMRAVAGEVTGLAAVIADNFASWSGDCQWGVVVWQQGWRHAGMVGTFSMDVAAHLTSRCRNHASLPPISGQASLRHGSLGLSGPITRP